MTPQRIDALKLAPPPVDLDCLRRQLALITEYLKLNVWGKK